MSMFASRTIETIPIPFAPGENATLRKLSGRDCDAAQAEHLKSLAAGQSAPHVWAKTFQQRLAQGTATAADAATVLADPLNGYDRHTLVKRGLIAWTLTDPALTPDAIEDLDDDAVDWFARAILERSKPALFAVDAEAAQKKADGPAPIA
jgi:hypothetical protein